MVPSFFAELIKGSIAGHAATRDARNRPESLRVWNPQVGADGRSLTFYVVRAQSGRTIENLCENGQLAVTITRLSDYRTVQLKGRVLGWRDARDDERPAIEASVDALATGADEEGLGCAVRRWTAWPSLAIEMQVTEVYNQTPRPGTGIKLDA